MTNTCSIQNKKRKYLGICCTDFELKSIMLINSKLSCTAQALNPRNIPLDVAKENRELFVSVAFNHRSEALYLYDLWWRDVKRDYGLPEDNTLAIDFNTSEFYILENDDE